MSYRLSIRLIVFLIGLLSVDFSFSQTNKFHYKSVPRKYTAKFEVNEESRSRTISRTPNLIDITSFLPKGYVRNGTVDYTEYIQRGINRHQNVLFPDFPVLVNDKGLVLRSNSIIIFNTNSKILLAPNGNPKYKILSLRGVEDVSIYYPIIIGDREKHLNNLGEWGMGIDIRLSKNINVYNPVVKDCWGDGICIGASSPSRSVNIYNAFLDNNRRNGLTIGSGININIIGIVSSNTHGARPMAGIDIEPNDNKDILRNIFIHNAITYNNGLRGILVALNNFKGMNKKDVSIKFVNHVDDGSHHAIGLALVGEKTGYAPKGRIEFIGSSWQNNSIEFVQKYDLKGNEVEVIFNNTRITNPFLTEVGPGILRQKLGTDKSIKIK